MIKLSKLKKYADKYIKFWIPNIVLSFFAFILLIPIIVFAVNSYNPNAGITFTSSIPILIVEILFLLLAISVIIMSIFLLVYAIFILVNLDNNKQNTIFILMLLGINKYFRSYSSYNG
ncbi:hypothetical protein ACJA27_02600 [Mycoplasmopsis lipophila]|uniref:hypothetical protein n=1 Tax=Mycoplasmopsis lipophila TaxID=2117 RepID=UPI0038736458